VHGISKARNLFDKRPEFPVRFERDLESLGTCGGTEDDNIIQQGRRHAKPCFPDEQVGR
jgi:hypothetical protein